jgi:hypothetical protein
VPELRVRRDDPASCELVEGELLGQGLDEGEAQLLVERFARSAQFSDHFPKPSIAASTPWNAVAPRLLRTLLEGHVRIEKPSAPPALSMS